jgi:hypothetical protein
MAAARRQPAPAPSSREADMTEPNPEEPSFEPIVVSYTLTAGDYAQYAAAVSRRNRSWSSFYIFVAVVFLAILVALFFRSVAAQSLDDFRGGRAGGSFQPVRL